MQADLTPVIRSGGGGVHLPYVKDPRLEHVRRQHRKVLEEVARLESALGREGSASDAHGGDGPVVAALGKFLDFCESTLEPLMRGEEQHVYPLLDRYLSREIGSTAAMLGEHETIRSLVSMLGASWTLMRQGAPEAKSDVAVLAQDLTLLLRDHVRKEDGVIHSLLEQLLRGSVRR